MRPTTVLLILVLAYLYMTREEQTQIVYREVDNRSGVRAGTGPSGDGGGGGGWQGVAQDAVRKGLDLLGGLFGRGRDGVAPPDPDGQMDINW